MTPISETATRRARASGQPAIEFWYEFASTYSYLAAARVEDLAGSEGVSVIWRPFLLGPIFGQFGLTDSPFNENPVKGAYMWRDMERMAAAYHLPLRKPTVFPRNGVLAARVALLGTDYGWCAAFSRAVYRANFGKNRDIADKGVIADILSGLGLSADRIIPAALSDENKLRLRRQTEAARAKGFFGAPVVTVGDEMFWGNDRLEQAIGWAKHGSWV